MKSFIVAIWVLVTCSAAGSISDKRGIGISSGYGGAYENYGEHIRYSTLPNIVSVNNPLQSNVATTGGHSEVSAYSALNDVNLDDGVKSRAIISSGYGTAYGYTSSTLVSDNKKRTESLDVLRGYGETDDNSSISNTDDINKEVVISAPVSSGYGRAYSYGPLREVVGDRKYLQSNIPFSNGYNGAYVNPAKSNIVSVNSDLRLSVPISSGYGGIYGYALVPSVSDSKNLKSTNAFPSGYGETKGDPPTKNTISVSDFTMGVTASSGYGGGYSYPLTSSVNSANDVINSQKIQQVSEVLKVLKMESMVDLPIYSTGFSGYGSTITSYSGYSRSPSYPGYGFSYASGWL